MSLASPPGLVEAFHTQESRADEAVRDFIMAVLSLEMLGQIPRDHTFIAGHGGAGDATVGSDKP